MAGRPPTPTVVASSTTGDPMDAHRALARTGDGARVTRPHRAASGRAAPPPALWTGLAWGLGHAGMVGAGGAAMPRLTSPATTGNGSYGTEPSRGRAAAETGAPQQLI